MKILDKLTGIKHENKTAVAIGCFDGIHRGHIEVINKILDKKSKGMLAVVLTFAQNPKFISAQEEKRIISPEQKYKILSDMGIDIVYSIDFFSIKNLSPGKFVKDVLLDKLNAGFISCGFNFRFGKDRKANSEDLIDLCSLYGVEVGITNPVIYKNLPVSSTRIRSALDTGDIKAVSELLGRPFRSE